MFIVLFKITKKKNKIKETYNNKYMEQKSFENMLDGLFFTKPIYYLDSTSRCKSIKNLEKSKNGAARIMVFKTVLKGFYGTLEAFVKPRRRVGFNF